MMDVNTLKKHVIFFNFIFTALMLVIGLALIRTMDGETESFNVSDLTSKVVLKKYLQ